MYRLVASFSMVLAASCGIEDALSGAADPRPTMPSANGAGSTVCRGLGLDDVGCDCPQLGVAQPCWPGDPLLRGRGDCHDGVQTCSKVSEFISWSECTGYHIGGSCTGTCVPSEFQSCKTGITPDDGGTGVGGGGGTKNPISPADGGGVTGTYMCSTECVPATVRWCDEPVYCRWGKQLCAKDGRWGVCIETNEKPGGCMAQLYDQQCCALAGACCQDMQDKKVDSAGHLVYGSIGQCTNISTPCP